MRYNPDGPEELNTRQRRKLRRLSDELTRTGRLFMFELLVPSEPAQLGRVGGDAKRYDCELRPDLMVWAITDLQDAGIEADVWKVEGLDRADDTTRLVEAARRGGRDHVGCIVVGRGEDEAHVRAWLQTAAGVPGFTGFAVGRTTFWDALRGWLAGDLTRAAATAQIATRYREWVDTYEAAQVRPPA